MLESFVNMNIIRAAPGRVSPSSRCTLDETQGSAGRAIASGAWGFCGTSRSVGSAEAATAGPHRLEMGVNVTDRIGPVCCPPRGQFWCMGCCGRKVPGRPDPPSRAGPHGAIGSGWRAPTGQRCRSARHATGASKKAFYADARQMHADARGWDIGQRTSTAHQDRQAGSRAFTP
jgi:hypothetical protein